MTSVRTTFLGVAFFLVFSCTVESASSEEASETPRDTSSAFKALHVLYNHGSFASAVSMGDFTREGPMLSTLIPLDKDMRAVAFDSTTNKCYGLTLHDVGEVDLQSGKLIPFASAPDISWPSGIALAESKRRMWISSATGAGGFLDALDVDSGQWRPQVKLGQTRLLEIAYNPKDDLLYGLPEVLGETTIGYILQLNTAGAIVGRIQLSEPIFLPTSAGPNAVVQMTLVGDGLFVLISESAPHPRLHPYRILRIQLPSGLVEAMPYQQEINLIEQLWPGMPTGPGPSSRLPDCCTEGVPSNYRTPDSVVADQTETFHVVSVLRGNVNALQQVMQHVKKVEIKDSRVGLELDLQSKASPVQVEVGPSEKPVVLGLAALEPVIWSVDLTKGSQVKRVILLGFKGQEVRGLPKGVEIVNRATGDMFSPGLRAAPAWELDEDPQGAFDQMIREFRTLAGLRESSFQGCQSGKRFRVPF